MYANVTAVQLSLVTIPYQHKTVAVIHAKNFLEINLSINLSAIALNRATTGSS